MGCRCGRPLGGAYGCAVSNAEPPERDGSGRPPAPAREAGAVQSVDRAVTALEYLGRTGEAGVSEVAEVIGVHKSTASRLLTVLQHRGLVEVAGERGRYRLGYGILRLAGAMGSRLEVTGAGRLICAGLAAELGETVNIAVRQGDQVVNVHQSDGGNSIAAHNWVGRPTPWHATSSGKILLAFTSGPDGAGPTEELVRYTDATVTNRVVLAGQLAAARTAGYAATAGEYEVGLNAVAAPVFGSEGSVVAAISMSAPTYRLPESSFPAVAARIIEAARRVSDRMGHLG